MLKRRPFDGLGSSLDRFTIIGLENGPGRSDIFNLEEMLCKRDFFESHVVTYRFSNHLKQIVGRDLLEGRWRGYSEDLL